MRILLLATLAVLLASPAPAQSPKPDDRIDVWTESRPVLERELKALAAANSMKGSYYARWETQNEGADPFKQDFPVDFALSKPENLFLSTKDLSVYSNGKTLTIYSKSLKHYITRPAPPIWSLRDVLEDLSAGQIRTIPSEALLRPALTLEQSLRAIRSMEKTRDGDYDGKPGTWVQGTGFDDRHKDGTALPFSFERWYAAADGLVYCIKQDWTRMYQDLADRAAAEQNEGQVNPKPAPKILTATWTTTYQRKMNVEISPETFIFTPSPGDTQVDRFVLNRDKLKEQTALLGQPAPEIIGTDLDGQTVKLSDFKGKVVVLDFWATWCGPCVAALPSMQELRNKHKDKPFVLLGVNRDTAGNAGKVKRFLTKKGFAIDQFDDSTGRAANAFFVNPIPCVIIIDKEGLVQDIDVGYIPGKERELNDKIDRLLQGRPLRTPEELARLRQQVDSIK